MSRFYSGLKITLIFFLAFYFGESRIHAQSNYPEEFTVDYNKLSTEAIDNETEFDENSAKRFYENLYQGKKDLFYSNSVYFNDSRSDYLRAIKDHLLKGDSKLKNEITIYVTRFSSKNAMCMPDGSIFFNIGLISASENEAQLAFILAHEIGHYKNAHARSSINKMNEIQEEEENSTNLAGNYFKRMRYSRENEFESDAFALSLMRSAGYNSSQSGLALGILADSLKLKLTKEDVMSILSSDMVTVEEEMFKPFKKEFGSSGEKLMIEDENDLFQTHPNMDKRILAITEIISSMSETYEGGDEYQVKDESEFKEIVSSCEKEMIENLFNKSEYVSGLLLSMEGLLNNSESQYMKVSVIRNLYRLAYFKEIENISAILEMNSLGKSEIMENIKGMISNMSFDELKKLTYGYTKKELANLNGDEELLFYHGLITRTYLGKEPARIIFDKYKASHPNGKYITYINSL